MRGRISNVGGAGALALAMSPRSRLPDFEPGPVRMLEIPAEPVVGAAPPRRRDAEVWAFHGNRVAESFAYEWRDDSRSWFRSYGDEKLEFDEARLTRLRIASINDLP